MQNSANVLSCLIFYKKENKNFKSVPFEYRMVFIYARMKEKFNVIFLTFFIKLQKVWFQMSWFSTSDLTPFVKISVVLRL